MIDNNQEGNRAMDLTIKDITNAEISALQLQAQASGKKFVSPIDVFMARVYAELSPLPPVLEAGLRYHYSTSSTNSSPRVSVYEVLAVVSLEGSPVVKLKRVYGNKAGGAGSTLVEDYDKIINDFLAGRCEEGDPWND